MLTDNQPTFTFSSSDATATFECSIDSQPFRACTTPFEPELGSGTRAVSVRATDAAANHSAVESRRFSVLPSLDVIFDSGPADEAHVAESSAMLGFHVTPADSSVTTQCAFDGGDFSTCTSPLTLASENSGRRTIAVRAIDAAGRAGAPEVRSLIFDNGKPFDDDVRPQTLLYDGPHGDEVIVNSPNIEFGANEQATFVCRVDAQDWASCESPWSPEGIDPGKHTYEIAAIDLNGSFTGAPAQGSFELDPGYRPESVNQAVDILDTAFPTVLDDEPTIQTPEGSLAPSLAADVVDDSDEFASSQALVESTVAIDPGDGFSVDTSNGSINIAPVNTESGHTDSVNVGGQAAIAGNVFDGASAFAKPTLTGASFGALMNSLATTESFSWELNVGSDIQLSLLPDGSVVATRELSPSDDDADQAAPPLPAPGETSGSGSSEYAASVAAMDAAQVATNSETLLLISAPTATDSLGNTVPAVFTVDNATKRVTLTVDATTSGAHGAVLVRADGISNLTSTIAKSKPKSVYFGVSGSRDIFGSLSQPLGALMGRMGQMAGEANAKNRTFRILVPWDSGNIDTQPCVDSNNVVYEGALATVNGANLSEAGGNPYKTDTRCADLWEVERKVKEIRDWAGASANSPENGVHIYLSPQPVHSSSIACDNPAAADPATRTMFPCSADAYKVAFPKLYVQLQGFANTHGGAIEFWSSFNEPDVYRWHGTDSKQNGVDAAKTWAVVQSAIRGGTSLGVCGACSAVAGEFGRTPPRAKEDRKKDLRYIYRQHLLWLAKKDNLPLPRYWSYHNYRDMAYPGERKFPGGDANIAKKGVDHGTGIFYYVKGISMLTSDAKLRKPGILMTEGGMNLQGGTPISGNDSWRGENKRSVKVPLAVNRFYYQINAGKGVHKAYMPGKDDLKYFKKIRGIFLYQLATGDGKGFDSSMFENPAQACSDWHAPIAAGCTADPIVRPPAQPRPAYCALLGFSKVSSKTICNGDNRPSVPDVKSKSVGSASIQTTRGSRTHAELMETRILLDMADFDLPPEYDYELSVSFEVCSRSLSVDENGDDDPICTNPKFCVISSCLANGIHENSSPVIDALRYTIPAGTDFSAAVPSSISAEVPIGYRATECEEDPRYRHVITPIFDLRIVGGDPFAEFNPSIPGPGDPPLDSADLGSIDHPSVTVQGKPDTGLYPGFWCS